MNLLKSIVFIFQGDSALSLKYAEEALAQIPASHHFTLGVADTFWGLACQMQGQKERCVQRLNDLLLNQPLKAVRKIRVMFPLAAVHIISGDLTVGYSLAQQLKNFAVSINSNHNIVWSSYLLGVISFCRNELDMAIEQMSQAAELGHIILRRAFVDCLGGLALAYQAKQQTDKADASIERLNTYVQSQENPELSDIAHSFAARLSTMRGEVGHAPGLSSRKEPSNGSSMFCWLELPDVTRCRLILAAGSESDLQEAEKMLQERLRLCQDHHNTFQTVLILPLLASVYEKQGQTEKALAVLEEAVDLAGPGEFIRPFVEAGPTIAGLLKRLAEKNIAVKYIGHILEAFPPPIQQPSSITQISDEELTNREHDILELLAQRLQSKEIAKKLFISTHTVNTHLKKIYRKLNVNNRRQAVARAQNLGIL